MQIFQIPHVEGNLAQMQLLATTILNGDIQNRGPDITNWLSPFHIQLLFIML